MAERDYTFLKNKYRELFLPTLLMVMSEKVCTLIDTFMITHFISASILAATSVSSSFIYYMGILYVLFGQGGSMLALRSKAAMDKEKANYYFTFLIMRIIITSFIYILAVCFFADNILYLFNIPQAIFEPAKQYLSIILFYLHLNAYIVVLSFFIRSDGSPNLTFYAILLSNVLNLMFDFIFIAGLNIGVAGAALASVMGYFVGAVYITIHYFKNERSFHFVSHSLNHVTESIATLKEIILNTPEVAGKIFFATKMMVLTYLSSTYLGTAGLLAFTIYDNSETFVYMFSSGIMKAMSPIVTIYYKECDFDAVKYTVVHSIRRLLIVIVPITLLFVIYPDVLLMLFNVKDPSYAPTVKLAIRITSLGLMGRCFTYLFANYAQATEKNKIVRVLFALNEFIIPVFGGIILTRFIGGVGIWIALTLGEVIPISIYIFVSRFQQKDRQNRLDQILILDESELMMLTYYEKNRDNFENYLKKGSQIILSKIGDRYSGFIYDYGRFVNKVCLDIFENTNIDHLDITIKYSREEVLVSITNEDDVNKELTSLDFNTVYKNILKNMTLIWNTTRF